MNILAKKKGKNFYFLPGVVFFIILVSANLNSISLQDLNRFRETLERNIGSILERPEYRNLGWGIMVTTVDGKHNLFQHQDDNLFIPASVVKIVTSGISLLKFGPNHKFETLLMTDAPLHLRVLNGNIYIKGQGDPALTIEDLRLAANSIKNHIDIITGDVIFDDSYLDIESPRYPPNARHLYAPAGALTVNYNWILLGLDNGPPVRMWTIPETSYARITYQVRISDSHRPGLPRMIYQRKPWGDHYHISGKITRWDRKYQVLRLCVTRPGLYTATLFKECCHKAGIVVRGTIRRGLIPSGCRILRTIQTRTMKEIVSTLNQESNNVVAELVNKNLGAVFDSLPGSREKGLNIIRIHLRKKLGLDKPDFHIRDASGLSTENRLSAHQLVLILNHLYIRLGKDFYETLALQGKHPHALNPTPPESIKIYVKSGTLPNTGVNTSAGYILIDQMETGLSFAVLANRRGSGPPAYSGTFTLPIMSAIIKSIKQLQ